MGNDSDRPTLGELEAKYETTDELEAASKNADLEPLRFADADFTYADADFTYAETTVPPDELHRKTTADGNGS